MGVEDDRGEVLFRVDLTDDLYLKGNTRQYTANFTSSSVPTKLVIWPNEINKGWLERIDINL